MAGADSPQAEPKQDLPQTKYRSNSWKDRAPRIDTQIVVAKSGPEVVGAPKAVVMADDNDKRPSVNSVTSPGGEQSDISLGPLETPTAGEPSSQYSGASRQQGCVLLSKNELAFVIAFETLAVLHIFTAGLGISTAALLDCFRKDDGDSRLPYLARWRTLIIVELLTFPLRFFFFMSFFVGIEFLIVIFHYHVLRKCVDEVKGVSPMVKDIARIGFSINVAGILTVVFIFSLILEPAIILCQALALYYIWKNRSDPPTRPEEQRNLYGKSSKAKDVSAV